MSLPLDLVIDEYPEARRQAFSSRLAFEASRERLRACDQNAVMKQFEERLHTESEDERCRLLEGLALLWGREASLMLVKWITDPSAVVRWVVCGCLHDVGDFRVMPALVERMQQDSDCQVRGEAASALGTAGTIEALSDLYRTSIRDFEVDPLGHTPSSCAREAINSALRKWVRRQLEISSAKEWHEVGGHGVVQGRVTAERVELDSLGRIVGTPRYAKLPETAFGFGTSFDWHVRMTPEPPFEVYVRFQGPDVTLERLFVFCQSDPGASTPYWSIHTIVEPHLLHGS